jgi:signal transduction protein with GAF and PtsI domain
MVDSELEMVRGRQAKNLLDNELLQECLDTIENKFTSAWMNSALSQGDVREEAYRMLAACKEFRRQLTHIIETGKMAAKSESDRQDIEAQERRIAGWDGSADTAPSGQH